jgi:hypothetical protein
MKKKDVLQLALQLNFWVALDILAHRIYTLWVLSNKLQKLQRLQFIIYMVQLITTQLQLYRNNSFSTLMHLPYNYNHNVMLMSSFIHPPKFNTWHYENISWFFKVLISIIHYDYLF